MTSGAGNTEFDISLGGTLFYARGRSEADTSVQLVGRDGDREPLVESPRAYVSAAPSPDGRLLAIWVEEANGTIFIHDLERGTTTRLATGFDNHVPVWSPDGRRLAFRSNRDGPFNIYWQAADGSDEAARLTSSENQQSPWSWSPDGKVLAFREFSPETGSDIWILPMDGTGAPESFLQSKHNEGAPDFSPDGRWIAYHSNESGRNEVYVRRFPDSGRKWQVSIDGGRLPRWNPTGGELFYSTGDHMMAVDVDTGGELALGTPRPLFEASPNNYGVMPDGNGFVMVSYRESDPTRTELILVQNWTEVLKRLVPTDN
jgi:serine/threonine-protein kinase